MNLIGDVKMFLLRWIYDTDNPPCNYFEVPDVGIVYASQEVIDKLIKKYGLRYRLICNPMDVNIIKEMIYDARFTNAR